MPQHINAEIGHESQALGSSALRKDIVLPEQRRLKP